MRAMEGGMREREREREREKKGGHEGVFIDYIHSLCVPVLGTTSEFPNQFQEMLYTKYHKYCAPLMYILLFNVSHSTTNCC